MSSRCCSLAASSASFCARAACSCLQLLLGLDLAVHVRQDAALGLVLEPGVVRRLGEGRALVQVGLRPLQDRLRALHVFLGLRVAQGLETLGFQIPASAQGSVRPALGILLPVEHVETILEELVRRLAFQGDAPILRVLDNAQRGIGGAAVGGHHALLRSHNRLHGLPVALDDLLVLIAQVVQGLEVVLANHGRAVFPATVFLRHLLGFGLPQNAQFLFLILQVFQGRFPLLVRQPAGLVDGLRRRVGHAASKQGQGGRDAEKGPTNRTHRQMRQGERPGQDGQRTGGRDGSHRNRLDRGRHLIGPAHKLHHRPQGVRQSCCPRPASSRSSAD